MRHRTHRPNRHYAAIPNAAMRDETLSIEARGMLALLMTYADNWRFRADHLAKVARVGRDKLTRIMRELDAAGYIKRERIRASDGTVHGSEWLIIDEPDRDTENQVVGDTEALKTRDPEKPTPGKSAHIRNSTSSEESQFVCENPHPLFPEFWKVYPRAQKREKAERAFSKAVRDGADPAHIIAAAKAYSAENDGNGRQYLALPENWLRDRRWRDHPDAKPASGSDAEGKWKDLIEKGLQSRSPIARENARRLAREHGFEELLQAADQSEGLRHAAE